MYKRSYTKTLKTFNNSVKKGTGQPEQIPATDPLWTHNKKKKFLTLDFLPHSTEVTTVRVLGLGLEMFYASTCISVDLDTLSCVVLFLSHPVALHTF